MLSIYQQRQASLLDALPDKSLVILPTAPVVYRNRDVAYPYRPDSDFYYLTGFDEPEAVAVWFRDGNQRLFWIFCRPRDPVRAQWEGEDCGPEEAQIRLQADAAYPIDSLQTQLIALSHLCQHFFTAAHWTGPAPELPHQEIRSLIAELRVKKSSVEITAMQRAVDISVEAHLRAMQYARPGEYEYMTEARLLETFYRHGSRSPAYPAIVAGGKNACVLHYKTNNQPLAPQSLLLIDAGAEYDYYAADITRTFPVSGKFLPHQRDLYNVVLAAQLAGIAVIRPGTPYTQIQEAVVAVLVEGLCDLGILRGQVADIIAEKRYRSVYMHGSGHWIGMDVHDVGAYTTPEGKPRLLEPGMVLTVEPGVYIREALAEIDPIWHNLGIRIEDDILVTSDGARVLSQALPKEVDEVEAVLGTA